MRLRSWLGIAAASAACALASFQALAQTPTPEVALAPCVHQPAPNDANVPTRRFDPIQPKQAAHELRNPLREGNPAQLMMLTFGDSAMWGNGLLDDYKYAHLVAQYVADNTGRRVNLVTYSHSGAKIADESDGCYEPMIPADHGTPPGDLNAGLPTAIQQETAAAQTKQYHDAELVLVDGCINDVGAGRIAYPFPFNRTTPAEIKKRAHEWCSDSMLTLVRNTLRDFPFATVIVSNYWLIISDQSKPVGVALSKNLEDFTPEERETYRNVEDLLEVQLEAERLMGQVSTDENALADPAATLRRWSDNSVAFLDESGRCFDWAVASADGATTMANPPDDCLTGKMHVEPQKVTPKVRTFLAKVPTDPQYSYGAPEKRVWSVPIQHVREDQMYGQRNSLCESHYASIGQLVICRINPTGHPDVTGAKAYSQSIGDILKVAWGR